MQTHTYAQRQTHKGTERLAHHTWTSVNNSHPHTFKQIRADTHPCRDSPPTHIYMKTQRKTCTSTHGYLQCNTHTAMETEPHRETQYHAHICIHKHVQTNPKTGVTQTETLPEGHDTELLVYSPKENWQECHPSCTPLIPLPPALIHGTLLKACQACSLAPGPQEKDPRAV